jgi:transcriptional regulator with XRE-family HTH domain
MTTASDLAWRLLRSRRDLDWRQEDLAEKSGVSRTYISEIERGRITNVGIEPIFALADALGVTVPYLLGLTDDPLGESSEKVLREQSADYVVFEVDSTDQRRTLQQLINEYTALTPRSQRQALQYLRMMRQLEIEEEETRGGAATPAPRIIGD